MAEFEKASDTRNFKKRVMAQGTPRTEKKNPKNRHRRTWTWESNPDGLSKIVERTKNLIVDISRSMHEIGPGL
jgi:beta-glucosidase/6-phospho-beta-glucosidase/beta-galactosidase